EVARLEPDLTRAVRARDLQRARRWDDRSTYERAFVQVMNLWREDEAARRISFSARLASTAAALLEVRGVRLYHDQALYKEPAEGAGGQTPWHVDQYYWPLTTDRAITAWVPLVDVPAEMGPLAFASGSHRFEDGRDLAISDESDEVCGRALAEAGFERSESPFAVGDVSFHLGWTFHCATPNRSARARKVMTVIYVDADMRVAEPANPNQRADLEAWFPGCAPGDAAASAINPLLWARGG
ncbi:MAG: phytanoyl-CoA dioxygenase family protein, partial [Planctomycetota bacterium]